MRGNKYYIALIVCIGTVLCGCSNSKHLPGGDSLFRGSHVVIADRAATHKERKILVSDLVGLVRPKPNSKFLGIRLKLSLYNLAGDTKKTKGLRAWLRNKVGEPPVLASSVSLSMDRELMINHLQNRGFFNVTVTDSMRKTKRKKATAEFIVSTDSQYTINKVYFRNDSSQIAHDVDSDFVNTLLTPNAPYNLELIKAERTRIDRTLKERGYFYFKPDYVLVIVDSSIGNHKVNMYVRLKHREIPEEAYSAYSINDIFIFTNYKLRGNKQDTSKEGKVAIDNYYVIDKKKKYNPKIFSRAMIFEKGDLYSLDDQNSSLSRLVNMGTFKFVKNRFDPIGDSLLDVYYYLTPYPEKSLQFQIGLLTQNDNRAGTQGSISWRHRNAFKGAEELLFKVSGGFEAQYSGEVKQPNIYNFGAETSLSFPRFVIPFVNIQSYSRYLPRTIVRFKYSYESESDLLRINSYTTSYGFDWKVGPKVEHQLYPFNFTYVSTDTFATGDRLKLLYGNLVFNGIIIGPTYEYTYNSQIGPQQKSSFFFDGLVDLSGNILGIVQKADYRDNPKEVFGSHYAQYLKFQPDFRYYLKLSPVSTLASRIMFGVGLPYGNSEQLPNVKQFWAGGNSDLRGFPSRLVGPGTFNATNDTSNSYIETLGDLKLEMNVELRQNIYKFINLGLFAEAGNIWLFNDNSALPGGKFTSDFYKELSADVGFGLRFDFKILLLRLDLGMPIRRPWLPENERWVFDKIKLSDPAWKRENLVFNIAIGYPF